MKQYDHPPIEDFDLIAVLHALAVPYRLSGVRKLAIAQPQPCAPLQGGRPKSSTSHHFMVLRKAGVVHTEIIGTTHMNRLRDAELNRRFPGLLEAVLKAVENEPLEGCGNAPQ